MGSADPEIRPSLNKTSKSLYRRGVKFFPAMEQNFVRMVVRTHVRRHTTPVMVGSQDPRIPYTWDPIGSGGSQRSEGSDLGFGFFRIRIQDPDHTANTSDPGSTDPDLN